MPLAGLVGMGEELSRDDGEIVGVVGVAVDGLDELADVGENREDALVVERLNFGHAGMQAVDVAAVVDGQQRALSEGQALAVLRVEAVVLLRGGDGITVLWPSLPPPRNTHTRA